MRVDDPPNRLHPKEHLRDRIHEARVAQVGNAPSTAAPLQLTQHVLAGNSVGVRAQVPARRQRPQQLRHAARVASGQHGSHLRPPVSRSPGRASATPSTAPATRRTTCGRRPICGPRLVASAAAAPAPPSRPCVRRNECRWHLQRLARAKRVRGQRRPHSRRSGRRPVRSSGSSGVVDAHLLNVARRAPRRTRRAQRQRPRHRRRRGRRARLRGSALATLSRSARPRRAARSRRTIPHVPAELLRLLPSDRETDSHHFLELCDPITNIRGRTPLQNIPRWQVIHQQAMRHTNATEHHVQVKPPLVGAHVCGLLKIHGRRVHAQPLRGLHSADSLGNQRKLISRDGTLDQHPPAIIVLVTIELPRSTMRSDLYDARAKPGLILEVIKLHKDGTRQLVAPIVTTPVSFVLEIATPIRVVIVGRELLGMEPYVHDFPHGVLHDLVLRGHLRSKPNTHADVQRTHTNQMTSMVDIRHLQHAHVLENSTPTMWQIHGLHVQQHLPLLPSLSRGAILHLPVHGLPANGHLETILDSIMLQPLVVLARSNHPPPHLLLLGLGEHLTFPHRLQETRHERAGRRWINEPILEAMRLVQKHGMSDAVKQNSLSVTDMLIDTIRLNTLQQGSHLHWRQLVKITQ